MKASDTRGTAEARPSWSWTTSNTPWRPEHAIRAVLEDRGYTVLVAASGEEALETARTTHAGPIHLAMRVDVIMPRMTGPELARMLRVLRPMRVLLTSGHTDRSTPRAATASASSTTSRCCGRPSRRRSW